MNEHSIENISGHFQATKKNAYSAIHNVNEKMQECLDKINDINKELEDKKIRMKKEKSVLSCKKERYESLKRVVSNLKNIAISSDN